MTNPDNAVGTNGAFGGRTSVNAFNDVLSSYASRGVISGWGIVPSSGMTLSIGGDGTDRDVAIAADATNNKTTVNNISEVPIEVTLDSAPASNSRYDAIVVYVDKPPISNATQDNPECCGIIPVSGMTASTPAYPDDATIRSAITADGASGATAYYAILGYVLVAAETTAITSAMITTMQAPALNASIDGSDLTPNSVTSDKIGFTASNIRVTVAGKSVNAQKVELGGGIVMISTHQLVTNVTFSASATNVKITGLPAMSTPLFCNLEAMQIGQSSTYVSYPHFSTDCQNADCYIRNTVAATGNLEVNFIVIGIPA